MYYNQIGKWRNQFEYHELVANMSGWPSGLRRQTQESDSSLHRSENSGPRMWAWVRIPLLTIPFFFLFASFVVWDFFHLEV